MAQDVSNRFQIRPLSSTMKGLRHFAGMTSSQELPVGYTRLSSSRVRFSIPPAPTTSCRGSSLRPRRARRHPTGPPRPILASIPPNLCHLSTKQVTSSSRELQHCRSGSRYTVTSNANSIRHTEQYGEIQNLSDPHCRPIRASSTIQCSRRTASSTMTSVICHISTI